MIKATPVTAYHPGANGIEEAKVESLKSLLRSLVKKDYQYFSPFVVQFFKKISCFGSKEKQGMSQRTVHFED